MQRLASLDLEAWAGGDRHTLMAIRPTETTGRVIVHESPARRGLSASSNPEAPTVPQPIDVKTLSQGPWR